MNSPTSSTTELVEITGMQNGTETKKKWLYFQNMAETLHSYSYIQTK